MYVVNDDRIESLITLSSEAKRPDSFHNVHNDQCNEYQGHSKLCETI